MKVLLALYRVLLDSILVQVVELGGATAIVYGVAQQWGQGPAWIVGGTAAVLKAFELDLAKPQDEQ